MAKEVFGLEITELRLGLPGDHRTGEPNEKKRVFPGYGEESGDKKNLFPATKSQVVGWPPVCSYRRKNSFNGKERTADGETAKIIMYVKVSADGAPFLRKIDLGACKGYGDLAVALEKLFGFGIRGAIRKGENSEYVPIYEDKDGDWMLAGDVPWQMFVESCKRLRIMKKSDAKGFGPQPRGAEHMMIGDY